MNENSKGVTPQDALKVTTLQNQINSPLLHLPAEIRNQIYRNILRVGFITICGDEFCEQRNMKFISEWETHAHFPLRLLRLLEVCQQIYAEARLLVFSLNTLCAGSTRYPKQFLADDWLDPSQEAAITRLDISTCVLILCHRNICAQRKLEICTTKARDRSDLKCLERFSGLQKIVLRLGKFKDYIVHDECEAKAKQEFEEAIKQEGRAIKVEYQDAFW